MTTPLLTSVATYRRTVHASEERVWENVRDWEHLPWLHRDSFRHIECVDAGDWGWRARIGLRPPGQEILLELCIEPGAARYVSRTLEGPGARTEIWTQVTPAGPTRTEIEVDFQVPGVEPSRGRALGEAFVALYTRLWDEDESMMVRRAQLLADRAGAPGAETADLGSLGDVRAALPRTVTLGGRTWRIVEIDGDLVAHATICPHMLGPLDAGDVEDGRLTCPWHGYRFDARTGRSCDGRGLRLTPAPRVEVDLATSAVRLVRA